MYGRRSGDRRCGRSESGGLTSRERLVHGAYRLSLADDTVGVNGSSFVVTDEYSRAATASPLSQLRLLHPVQCMEVPE